MPLLRPACRFILLALTLLAAMPARTADTPAVPPASDPLKPAREQIEARRWPAAIEELQRINATGLADWQNLMGYAHRKLTPPDLAAAEAHYNEALRLNPQHRGALEYSGELYLMKGDLPTAEARLAMLDKACTFSCEEYRDLKKAVERYKANGGRYSPDT